VGQDDIRRPNGWTGRLTTSSPAFHECPAGEAAWKISVLPGSSSLTGAPAAGVTSTPPDINTEPAQAPNGSPCRSAPSRASCDKEDPQASECDQDGTVVPGGQVTGPLHGTEFTVELWWSPSCQTNWARARPTGGRSARFAPWIEPARGDATRFFATLGMHSDWIDSPMAYSDGGAKAAAGCVIVPGGEKPYYLCTPMLTHDGGRA
jgi:hypothetical protein